MPGLFPALSLKVSYYGLARRSGPGRSRPGKTTQVPLECRLHPTPEAGGLPYTPPSAPLRPGSCEKLGGRKRLAFLTGSSQLGTMSDGEWPRSGLSQASSVLTISSVTLGAKPIRSVRRVHTFGKRGNSIKRDPNSPVVIRGWLYKQDSSGLKLWKRRWFVLSNYCLFYYRDSREEMVLGSILLPSYEIRILPKEAKNRRFTFKAEHPGMRTYHFSADTQEDMNGWVRAMSQSAAAESERSTLSRAPALPMPVHPQDRLYASFEDVTQAVPPQALAPAPSAESLEIARLAEPQDRVHSSSESLPPAGHGENGDGGSVHSATAGPPSPTNREWGRGEAAGRSLLCSQTPPGQAPSEPESASGEPHRPPPPQQPPSPALPLSDPSPYPPVPSPFLSARASHSYSLPPTPVELSKAPGAPPNPSTPPQTRRRARAAPLAASCEELPILAHPWHSRALVRPHTPVGRMDIAPGSKTLGDPQAVGGTRGRSTLGHPQTPSERYDILPYEDPYARPLGRYLRSPHPTRARPGTPAEELQGNTGTSGHSLGRPHRGRISDRAFPFPGGGPPRARPHGRLPRSLAPLLHDRSHFLSTPGSEGDTDVLLTKLCGQDKLLRSLEEETGHLRAEKERLEKALEVTRHQLEDFKGHDLATEKIWYQQRRLQDELVQVRAQLSDLALDSERAWAEYAALENELQMLRETLAQIRHLGHPHEQEAAQQELWMIEDILAGLKTHGPPCPVPDTRRCPGLSPATSPVLEHWVGSTPSSFPFPGLEEPRDPQELLLMVPGVTPHKLPLPLPQSTPDHEPTLEPTGRMDQPAAGHSPPVSAVFGGANWGSRPPQSPPRGGARSPEPERGNPNLIAPGLGSQTAALHLPWTPSPTSYEPWEQRPVELPAKVSVPVPSTPHRTRMSAQEQLERMRRHQEAQRSQDGGRPSPPGPRRSSLRGSASRLPLLVPPPNPGPEPAQPCRGGANGGPWGPCVPGAKRDRQQIVSLSYTLASEASQRSKLITGRTPYEPQLGGRKPHSEPHQEQLDALTNQHLMLSATRIHGEYQANHVVAERDCSPNQPAVFPISTGLQSGAASQGSPLSWNSDWALPILEASSRISALSEMPNQVSPSWTEATNQASSMPDTSLPEPTNQVSVSPEVSNQVSSPAPSNPATARGYGEQRIVGNEGLVNGGYQGQSGGTKPSQVRVHLSEASQPIRITLLQSSF
ncbi:pleckstrin homology domain-containing family A member 4 isoform X2 [Alligator mississippiensis]|uniref:pleckstrin homology domain-containing family A member 4 isoform X2 n=1 Tax=Alligator mississippiensis TaxID=8496 RepID=UPI002877A93B|nr:pleckstrin homology domain-containing family A member 4 isoform X2 [Alligator mississippiensis]